MLTLAEAKTHLRVDHDDDDDYIGALVSAAQLHIERLLTPAPVDGVAQSAPAVNETQKQACRLLVGHWYEHREAVSEGALVEVPFAVDMLLQFDRPPEGLF